MPIGKVCIYRLLFFVSFVCTVTIFFYEDKASSVKFCMLVHQHPGQGFSHFGSLLSTTVDQPILTNISISAVRFWIFINRFGFRLKQRFRFRFQNCHGTTFNKKYNQPSTCLRSANKPTSLQQSSTRHSRRAIKANWR